MQAELDFGFSLCAAPFSEFLSRYFRGSEWRYNKGVNPMRSEVRRSEVRLRKRLGGRSDKGRSE